MANEIAKKEEEGALVEASAYAGYEGMGYENQTKDDSKIPTIDILQMMSPACKLRDAENKPMHFAGMLWNSAAEESIEGTAGVGFIAATTLHVYVEYKPNRGGFVGLHTPESAIVQEAKGRCDFGKWTTQDGNDLVDTFEIYAVITDGPWRGSPVVFRFTSTKINAYKTWNTKLRSFKLNGKSLPMFAHQTMMKTEEKSNDHGDFFIPVLSPYNADVQASLVSPDDPMFQAALALREVINSGEKTADYEEAQGSSGDGGDVPFMNDDEKLFN